VRDERAAKRAKKIKVFPKFHDMLLGIWMLSAREGQRKARAVKAQTPKERG
jgi:hypothetical protein